MNIVLIIVVIFLVLSILNGLRVGFIKSAISLIGSVVSLMFSVWLLPIGSKLLKSTPIFDWVRDGIEKIVMANMTLPSDKVADQIEAINGIKVPEFLKQSLIENNNGQIYEALGINSFQNYVSNYLATVVINAVSIMITFIIIFAAFKIIGRVLDIVSKLPILNTFNKIGGLIFGFVNGLLIIWVSCLIITIFCGTEWGSYIYEQINQSQLLTYIYEHNVLIDFISNMNKVLF